MILLSHGSNGQILGTDMKPVDIEEQIISMFQDDNAPGLKGIPKIFLIQACRNERKSKYIAITMKSLSHSRIAQAVKHIIYPTLFILISGTVTVNVIMNILSLTEETIAPAGDKPSHVPNEDQLDTRPIIFTMSRSLRTDMLVAYACVAGM